MRNWGRSFGARFGQTFVVIVGALGAMVAFDAVLLFFVLLLAAPSPYMGLLMFIAAPILVLLGGGTAWVAYSILRDRQSDLEGGRRQVHT